MSDAKRFTRAVRARRAAIRDMQPWLESFRVFSAHCRQTEYTDTDEAWRLLNRAAKLMRKTVRTAR